MKYFISAILLVGCDADIQKITNSKAQYETNSVVKYSTVCIDGMMYLVSSTGNLTPKYRASQYVEMCDK